MQKRLILLFVITLPLFTIQFLIADNAELPSDRELEQNEESVEEIDPELTEEPSSIVIHDSSKPLPTQNIDLQIETETAEEQTLKQEKISAKPPIMQQQLKPIQPQAQPQIKTQQPMAAALAAGTPQAQQMAAALAAGAPQMQQQMGALAGTPQAQKMAAAIAAGATPAQLMAMQAKISQDALMQDINKLRGIFIRNLLTPKPPLSFSFSGYIKHDAFFDSYQVIGLRQDHYLLFPDQPLFDRCGRNINRKGRFDMMNIETRARAEVVGPKIFGAYPFGAIEADFWGGALDGIGLCRLRHAFIYLEWPRTSLLIGQYWHPVFVTDCYPDTISFNNGSPIEPYAREPQIRITTHHDNITLIFAATSYAAALIDRPNPAFTQLNIPFSNFTERNSVMPDFHFQMRADIRKHFLGVGFDLRRLIPRLAAPQPPTSLILAVRESLISFLGMAYAKLNWEQCSLALKVIFAQNGLVFDMISGYAASCQDTLSQSRNYTNLQCVSCWADFVWKGKVEPGLFVGVTKNVGAGTTIIPATAWGLESNRQLIDYVARISPRVRWFVDPLIFGWEFEITRAGWGTLNERGRVDNVTPATNYRALFAAYFCF